MYIAPNTEVPTWGFQINGCDGASLILSVLYPPFNPGRRYLYAPFPRTLITSMSSPVGNRPATAGMRSPKSCLKPSKQRRSASTRKLPNSPLKVTSPGRKSVTNWQQSYSPSLVQFSYQQTPARYALNVFSVIRLVIAAGAIAGIVLCALQTRSSTTESLQGNVLKLLFVRMFPFTPLFVAGLADVSLQSLHSLFCSRFSTSSSSTIISYRIEWRQCSTSSSPRPSYHSS